MSAPQDRDCLRRISQQDESALAELYDRYIGLLYPVALRIVGSEAQAEDIMQEVWLQVWRKAATYDAKRGVVPAWLLTITRSRALDSMRSRKARRRRELEAEVSAADDPNRFTEKKASVDPALAVEVGSMRETLVRALASIEPHQSQVLQLAYWEGLSQSQIAERLGSPLGTVKSWTRQGLRELRKVLPPGEWW